MEVRWHQAPKVVMVAPQSDSHHGSVDVKLPAIIHHLHLQ